MRFFVLASVLVLGSAQAATKASAGFEWQSSPSKETAREVIRTRKFAGHRDLLTYLQEFPPDFADDLFKMGAGKRVLDAGAGAAYFAEEVVSLRKVPAQAKALNPHIKKSLSTFLDVPLADRPRVTAISLNLERNNIPTYEGKLEVLWGRFFGEIPKEELGEFDLISDMKGIFAYSPDADEVLRRYATLLKQGGVLYLYLGEDSENGFAFRSHVKRKDGEQVTLAQWLQSVPGLKSTLVVGSGEAVSSRHQTLRVMVEDETKVNIPKLTLLGIDAQKDGPPTRIYWER